MSGNADTETQAAVSAEDRKWVRSEIGFPYADLERAVEIATVLHSKTGMSSCDIDELAGWMNQSATGGTFRTRIAATKMFGLIDYAQGKATLTQLGRDALDGSGGERAARVEAFLNVELFRAMYEQNKAAVLPPPAALERQVVQLGVSANQKERARQTFMKSATYAGFIDQSSGRFIKPGVGNRAPQAEPVASAESEDRSNGGGGGPTGLHPFVQGLLRELPPAGQPWAEAKRKLWLDTAASIFKMIYPDTDEAAN